MPPTCAVSVELPRRRPGAGNLTQGAEVIRGYLRTLPNGPGVYRMMNADGDVLYVGKAKSLKKRVVNYTQVMKLPTRLQRMVAETEEAGNGAAGNGAGQPVVKAEKALPA